MSYGTPGIGTTHHLSGVLIEQMTGVQMVHVPYKSSPQSTTDLIGGRVDIVFTTLSTFLPFVDSGKLRIVAINGGSRYDKLPDVPTVNDLLPGFERPSSWIGVFAPGGTPRDVLARISEETQRALKLPDIAPRVPSWGGDPAGTTPDEFEKRYHADIAKYRRIVKEAGIPPLD